MTDYSSIFPDIDEKMYGPGALEAQLTMSAQENPFSIPYMLAARMRGQRARGDYFDDLSALTNQRAQKTMQLNEADMQNKLMEDFFTKRASTQMAAENLGLPFNRPDIQELSNIGVRGQEADVAKTNAETAKMLKEAGLEIAPEPGVPFQDLGFGGLNRVTPLGVQEKQAGTGDPNDPLVEVTDQIFNRPGDMSGTVIKRKVPQSVADRMLAEKEARRLAQLKGDKNALATAPGAGGGKQSGTSADIQYAPSDQLEKAPPQQPPSGNDAASIERDGLIMSTSMLDPGVRQKIETTLGQIGGTIVPRGVRTNLGKVIVYMDTAKGRQRFVFNFETGELEQ